MARSFADKWDKYGVIKPVKWALHFQTQRGHGLALASGCEAEEVIQFARAEILRSGKASEGSEVSFNDIVMVERADVNEWPVGRALIDRFTNFAEMKYTPVSEQKKIEEVPVDDPNFTPPTHVNGVPWDEAGEQ